MNPKFPLPTADFTIRRDDRVALWFGVALFFLMAGMMPAILLINGQLDMVGWVVGSLMTVGGGLTCWWMLRRALKTKPIEYTFSPKRRALLIAREGHVSQQIPFSQLRQIVFQHTIYRGHDLYELKLIYAASGQEITALLVAGPSGVQLQKTALHIAQIAGVAMVRAAPDVEYASKGRDLNAPQTKPSQAPPPLLDVPNRLRVEQSSDSITLHVKKLRWAALFYLGALVSVVAIIAGLGYFLWAYVGGDKGIMLGSLVLGVVLGCGGVVGFVAAQRWAQRHAQAGFCIRIDPSGVFYTQDRPVRVGLTPSERFWPRAQVRDIIIRRPSFFGFSSLEIVVGLDTIPLAFGLTHAEAVVAQHLIASYLTAPLAARPKPHRAPRQR